MLLTACQTGTLAQFEAHAGNGVQALNLTRRARRALGDQRPAVADAWLSSVEALGHAAAGDPPSTDQALTTSRTAAEALRTDQEPPPWPWVFSFTPDKVAACRVTCGARLQLPEWVLGEDVEALTTGHAKQRALPVLDIAAGHLAGGRVEARPPGRPCQQYDPAELNGVSCIADGPDSWFAEAVLQHGGRLEVVVPAVEYREGLPDWHHPVYDRLISRAADVHHTGMTASTSEAHQAGSEILVGLVDELIAVWDGKPARGHRGRVGIPRTDRRPGVCPMARGRQPMTEAQEGRHAASAGR